MNEAPICPHCGRDSEKVSGDRIYPHRPDLYHRQFYLCAPCDAYVGCHKDTGEPLGTPANAQLRKARAQAHATFDPLWKGRGRGTRGRGYRWLAEQLGIPGEQCHIGMMDLQQCQQVIAVCEPYLRKVQRP